MTCLILVLALAMSQSALPLQTIARGTMSGIDAPREVVVRTAEEWADLWKLHEPSRPVPGVDFAQAVVVAVFAGSRPTAGYSVEIREVVREEGGGLVVRYAVRTPPAGAMSAQVITSPYHIASVAAAQADEVSFRQVEDRVRQ